MEVWAANFSHTDAYAKAVMERLVAADTPGATSSNVVAVLTILAREFKVGTYH
jgi:hypothetical protein